jgi:hypothetical protein
LLAQHKWPAHWFVVDAIPAITLGKLQKFRLSEMVKSGELEPARI